MSDVLLFKKEEIASDFSKKDAVQAKKDDLAKKEFSAFIEVESGVFVDYSEKGIFVMKSGKSTQISAIPAKPSRIIEVDDKKHVELIFGESEEDSKTLVLPLGALTSPSYYKEELRRAADAGLNVETRSRFLRVTGDVVLKLLSENALKVEKGHSSLGWSGNEFITSDSVNYVGNNAKRNESAGCEQTQLDLVKSIILRFPAFGALVSVALSGFLHGKLKIDHSPIFHIFGKGGTGKTTAMIILSSLLGRPEIGQGALVGWDSSSSGIENVLVNLNNQFLCLDDLSLVDSKSIEKTRETLFKIANGGGRALSKTTGELRAIKTWDCQIFSTGNKSIHGIISGDNEQSRALAQRITEIDVSYFHLFENAEKEFFNNTKQILSENYGHLLSHVVNTIQDEAIFSQIKNDYFDSHSDFYEITKNDRKAAIYSLWFTSVLILEKIFNLSIEESHRIKSSLNKMLCSCIVDNEDSHRDSALQMIQVIYSQKMNHLKFRNTNSRDMSFSDHNKIIIRFGAIGEIINDNDTETMPVSDISIEHSSTFIIYDTALTREILNKIGIQLDELISHCKKADMIIKFADRDKGAVASQGKIKGWKINLEAF